MTADHIYLHQACYPNYGTLYSLEPNPRIFSNNEDNEGFIQLCKYLEKNYPKIRFFGGYRIKDGKQLYKFDSDIVDSDIHLWIASSMKDSKWYEKVLPKLYSRRKNKENYLKVKPGINLFDFV